MSEQPVFDRQRLARCGMHEPSQPLCGNNPMTGDEDGQGIGTTCLTDGTSSRAKLPGQHAVGDGFPRRDFHQRLPHAHLEMGTLRLEREVELVQRISPVGCQFVCETPAARIGYGREVECCRQEIQPCQRCAVKAGTETADRGFEDRIVGWKHYIILAAESTTPSEEGVAGLDRKSYSAALPAALRAGSFSLIRADLPERSRR